MSLFVQFFLMVTCLTANSSSVFLTFNIIGDELLLNFGAKFQR